MKRLLCALLVALFCLTGCGFWGGNQHPSPEGTYTDEQETVRFIFEEDRLTLEGANGVFATGTFTMSGLDVKITFEGDFADYLNTLGSLSYNAADETLTDAAGQVLHTLQPTE